MHWSLESVAGCRRRRITESEIYINVDGGENAVHGPRNQHQTVTTTDQFYDCYLLVVIAERVLLLLFFKWASFILWSIVDTINYRTIRIKTKKTDVFAVWRYTETVAWNNASIIALLKDDHRNGLHIFPTR